MPHQNERVALAMNILECRRKLRQTVCDDEAAKDIQAEMERLMQKLRELDG
jgi:hypothetical protein